MNILIEELPEAIQSKLMALIPSGIDYGIGDYCTYKYGYLSLDYDDWLGEYTETVGFFVDLDLS
jgi:hypothetical protein